MSYEVIGSNKSYGIIKKAKKLNYLSILVMIFNKPVE